MEHKQQCECKDKQHVLKKKGADLQKIQTTGVKRNKTGKNTLKHEDRGATTGKRRRAMGPLPTLEPYLCTCFKPAHVTITKADAILLGADAQQCQHGTHCKPGGIFLRGLQKQHVLKKKGAYLQKIQDTGVERNKTGKKTLKHEGPQAQATDPGIVSSPLNTNMKKNSLQNSFQEKAVGRRNSFQNTRKPDITRVELLKDVQSKNDLIFRLVAHDIDRVDLKNDINEELNSDEDEVVLRETVAEEDFKVFKDQVKEVKRPEENKVSPKSTRSTSRLKKLLSLFNCCQTTASVNIESTEATSNQVIESKETHVKRPVAELDMAIKKAMPETASSSWEEKPLCKKEEKNLLNEPPHYFIHRIMSSSSYDQEDLISSTSEAEDRYSDPSAEILEESSQEQKPENRSSVEFITIFERSKDVDNANSSNISETPKPNVSKRGCKMLTKMSSALSKVFSRNNTNISRSSSPTHHHED
ncbi:fibrous sheath-interacting protein 2-like isoform X9 [Aotus nancymaae]|uniref:fibrous sheath-interacting protein 2-like isoform X9 n=1 Tax=Aotus nancymaae TaxID=37293 RepID=UPI0030FF225D